MLRAVEGLIESLRAIGVPVSTGAGIDAARSLQHIDIGDREQVRMALGATLVARQDHRSTFDTMFDLFFAPPQPGTPDLDIPFTPGNSASGPPARGINAHLAGLDDDGLHRLLVQILHTDDELGLRPIVAQLVDRHAVIRPGQPVAGTFYVFRTYRATDPERLRQRLLDLSDDGSSGPGAELHRRLLADEADRRIERLRQEIEAEVRRRLVDDRGAAAVARSLRSTLPEDVNFLTAATSELTELQTALASLPAQLAHQLSERRRRSHRGQLDFRRTIRTSLSSGGVPIDPVFRRPHPPKPELFVLADISGSVATFARFTLQLAHAMRTQFRSVRSFAFVDGIDEVTDILAGSDDIRVVAERIDEAGSGVWLDGRSDYGNAFRSFDDRFGSQVTSRSIVLVLGDGRSNYRAAQEQSFARISRRAGRTYWLNPEAKVSWATGDSVTNRYAPHCSGMHECRNLRQLKDFVETLA